MYPAETSRRPIDRIVHNAKLSLAAYGLGIALLCLTIVLAHYALSMFQPVRWPTKVYFVASLLLALFSRKWSTFFVIFSLPLLPELHIQAEHILKPAVKYFVGYVGVDVIAGFFLGHWLRARLIEKAQPKLTEIQALWPLGLLLLGLSCSTAIAITRNLWQSASSFSVVDLADHLLKFKFLIRTDNYYPLAELIVFAFCFLLIITLLDTLKQATSKDEVIFKPLLASLAVSAFWGIFQALTKFGLPANTYGYRPENFGFAAQGFQPDLHAFAGHMLLGVIGLYGLIICTASSKMRNLSVLVGALCWVALVLSKSRASLMFAAVGTVLFIFWLFMNRPMRPMQRLLVLVLSVGSILCFIILTNNHKWIVQYYEVFSNANWTKVFYSLYDKDFSGFATLNALSRDRLELHGAALRMGWAYPFFGIGLGDFFRMSSIIEFSGSPFMVRLGGENAHNYFFQTFAEVGFLGIFCFSLIFLVPVFNCSKRQLLVPVAIAILSIFAGNVYSHSLIIKENLFLLTCLLALLIAYQSEGIRCDYFDRIKKSKLKIALLFCVISAVVFFTLKEINGSFYKIPFNMIR